MAEKYTLKKSERISSQKEIDLLFQDAASFIAYPLRVLYVQQTMEGGMLASSVLVSVSKKKFKKASDRNRLKRQIKEAYRLHKPDFWTNLMPKNTSFLIAFLYVGQGLCEYSQIEEGIKKALFTIQNKAS